MILVELDPYDGRKLDNNKLTAMIWYVGDQIASYQLDTPQETLYMVA